MIGDDVLGFKKDDIGFHSIWAGVAIDVLLSVTSVIIITRFGRWSSEAFLEYIREQVEYFTFNVSQRMLKFEEISNFSRENSEKSTHEVINIDYVNFVNKDGPYLVMFRIKFNGLALYNGNENE